MFTAYLDVQQISTVLCLLLFRGVGSPHAWSCLWHHASLDRCSPINIMFSPVILGCLSFWAELVLIYTNFICLLPLSNNNDICTYRSILGKTNRQFASCIFTLYTLTQAKTLYQLHWALFSFPQSPEPLVFFAS